MNAENGYTIGLPPVASSYGSDIDALMLLMHVVMVAIFVIWGVYFVYCLVKYRAKDGERGVYHQAGENASFIPDGIILVFEIWLILAFGIPMWVSIKQQTPPPEESLEIVLVAEQFAWNFQYPGADRKFGRRDVKLVSASNAIGLDATDPAAKDDVVTVNNLHVPMNKPVILRMTSKDVIHDFQVTNFRNKQDILPGQMTMLWFEPTVPGKYEIACAQLCGLGHTKMIGNVFVDSQQDWDKWFQEELEYKTADAGTTGSDEAAVVSRQGSGDEKQETVL
ncbi:MAG: cytochrome c oxidase subunit II [Deltaproteobacteria bacterium]|nr:cytochrome c oxidase subunit II [Deltaproteobacteria bacterium]